MQTRRPLKMSFTLSCMLNLTVAWMQEGLFLSFVAAEESQQQIGFSQRENKVRKPCKPYTPECNEVNNILQSFFNTLSIMCPPYPEPPKTSIPKQNKKKNWLWIDTESMGLSQSLSRLMTTRGTVALCSTKENGHYRQMVQVCACMQPYVCIHRCIDRPSVTATGK